MVIMIPGSVRGVVPDSARTRSQKQMASDVSYLLFRRWVLLAYPSQAGSIMLMPQDLQYKIFGEVAHVGPGISRMEHASRVMDQVYSTPEGERYAEEFMRSRSDSEYTTRLTYWLQKFHRYLRVCINQHLADLKYTTPDVFTKSGAFISDVAAAWTVKMIEPNTLCQGYKAAEEALTDWDTFLTGAQEEGVLDLSLVGEVG